MVVALIGVSTAHAASPLSVNPANPRYFVDASGAPIYLAGTYAPYEKIELGTQDFTAYLDSLQQQKHNFTKLWAWEQTPVNARYAMSTLPYERTGPGTALDGGAKFDLRRFNQNFFNQLRARVAQARDRGIYVSVVLFQGLDTQAKKKSANNSWSANPFNRNNNVNKIDGDPNRDGIGDEAFSLTIAAITSLQEAYVRKVVDTLNDLDNVVYEISGDGPLGTVAWQNHIINYLKGYEASKSKQHPVGIDYLFGTDPLSAFNSPADWIVIYGADLNPPLAVGAKVLFWEVNPSQLTDGASHQSVWKSFTRGFNVIDQELNFVSPGISQSLHAAVSQSIAYSGFINLFATAPSDVVCSSGYCLVASGAEYLLYLPNGGSTTMDLSATRQNFSVNWFNPGTGQTLAGNTVTGGGPVNLTSPFNGETLAHLLYQAQTTSPSATTTTGLISTTGTSTPLTSKAASSGSSGNVDAPTITPNGGSFSGSVSVTLGTSTGGATIYYTTDGSSPSQRSSQYSSPITLSADTLLKAIAYRKKNSSAETSAWFAKTNSFDFTLSNSGNVSVQAGATITNSISAATISALTQTVTNSLSSLTSASTQTVSFSASGLPAGATASFSSTSCSPSCSTVLTIGTSSSTPTGSFPVTVASTGGGVTKTSTFTLSVSAAVVSTVATPTFTPNGGSFAGSVSVSIASATSGASIYYTTDGSSPTQSSALYSGPMTLISNTTVKAKAFKSGYNPSAEAAASFTQSSTSTTNSGLVAYWNFDEGTGTVAADSSGNGNHGTLVNGPTWAAGISGNALYFDGINDNVTVLNSNTLNPTRSFTVSAWVNPASTFTDFRSILVKNYKYYLYASVAGYCGNGSPLGGFSEVTDNTVCQPAPLPINTWTHLSVTFDGSTLTLYRNGVAVAMSAASETLSPTTGTLQIGASQYGEYFQGLIDEVRIYNRALTYTEIQTIYQQVAVNLPSDYSLSTLGDRSVIAGSSVTNTINATLVSGTPQAVSFSVSGLPAGATATFSSTSCSPSCSTVLTISTSGSTPAGSFPITVTSAGGGVKRSTVFTLSVTLALTVATPTFTPNGGTFSNSVSVTIGTATPGSAIYYTMDGSTPTQSSILYTGPMTLTSNATVQAAAFKSGANPSAIAAATFTNSLPGTTGTGKTYYVATNGSDAYSCSLAQNPATPKRNIMGASGGIACLVAGNGDTLDIRAGTYSEDIGNNTQTFPSGTSYANAATIQGHAGETVTVTSIGVGGTNTGMTSYMIFSNLLVRLSGTSGTSSQAVWVGQGAHHIRFTDVDAVDTNCVGVLFDETSHHNEWIRGAAHDTGTGCAPGLPADTAGYPFYINGQNNLIEYAKAYNGKSYGIHNYSGYPANPASNNTFRYNQVYNNGSVVESSAGILAGEGDNIQVYGNIVYGNKHGIAVGNGATNAKIYNNTSTGNTYSGLDLTNVNTDTIAKNNIFYNNTGGDIWAGGTRTVYGNNLCGATGTGCGVVGNPLFVGSAAGNFALKVGSAAVDRGATLGEIPAVDLLGTARPKGAAWDIGAVESW